MSHILIVDDSPTIRRMVRASLAPLGGEFSDASSGLDAIEKLALSPIELMVLDLNMPDMHGIDVLRFLRRHQVYRDLPVIILTTRGDDSSRAMCSTSGITARIGRPRIGHSSW